MHHSNEHYQTFADITNTFTGITKHLQTLPIHSGACIIAMLQLQSVAAASSKFLANITNTFTDITKHLQTLPNTCRHYQYTQVHASRCTGRSTCLGTGGRRMQSQCFHSDEPSFPLSLLSSRNSRTNEEEPRASSCHCEFVPPEILHVKSFRVVAEE